jgi:predicted dehydrogenase
MLRQRSKPKDRDYRYGRRGIEAVHRLKLIEGVEIRALCDLRMECVDAGQKALTVAGLPAARTYGGTEDAWKEMCSEDDLDLVYIVTPWNLHTPMSVFAMNNGKHAAVEVPAAVTLEECWELVETSEKTRKHCMMLENCCYDFFELLTLNMVRQGFFGEIIHGEGAYIHHIPPSDPPKPLEYADKWRIMQTQGRKGNYYPTHGLGPICQAMNINRSDKLNYMTSMSCKDFVHNRQYR